jgi:hypothetical protein
MSFDPDNACFTLDPRLRGTITSARDWDRLGEQWLEAFEASVFPYALSSANTFDYARFAANVQTTGMTLSDTCVDRTRRAIEAMPDAALALFSLWDRATARRFASVRWPERDGFPRSMSTPLARRSSCRKMSPRDIWTMLGAATGHGPRISSCTGICAQPTFIGVPNLADHQDLSSLAGNAFRGPRLSACFLPADPAAEEGSRLTALSAVPFFKNGIAQCAVRIPGSRRPRWQHLECEQYLGRWGVPVENLRSRLRQIAAGLDPAAAWGVWSG